MITTLTELKTLFTGYNAYLVGGGARAILRGHVTKQLKDWDVVVDGTFAGLPQDHAWVSNSFGGFKYRELGLDTWPQNIGEFLRQVPRYKDGLAYHLETGAWLFTKEFIYSGVFELEMYRKLEDGKVTGRKVVTHPGKQS